MDDVQENKNIETLLADYKLLEQQATPMRVALASIDETIAKVRAMIMARMVEKGFNKFDGSEFHVTYISPAPSVSFDTKAVSNLIDAWTKSKDPIINTCGVTLGGLSQTKARSAYIQIKKKE